eukprot:TRINITY_DN4324_c0_g1_i4.p1 TRINITY_DN4324_c0_g1~~TRINITY_DN4324_c0_g1_i4.p1  ORF type:complete len:287 (-),score=30.61 TRINITY_DN4324_c0_g1_i4:589-1449(-)
MIRDCTTPRSICSGSVGSGRSRWADLHVEDEADLAVAPDLGVWASASSDGSDNAARKAAHRGKPCIQNESSSESDSSGYAGQAELGGKRVAPPSSNNMPQSSAACHHITFASDSSRSGSDGPHASGSLSSEPLPMGEKGGREYLDHMRNRHMRNVSVQSYLDSFTGSMSSGQDGAAAPLPVQRMDVSPSTASEAFMQELPSAGSALHPSGSCKPCLLISSPLGCHKGALCDFCHFKHARKNMRPNKGKRERFKRLLERAEHLAASYTDPEGGEEARAPLGKGLVSL